MASKVEILEYVILDKRSHNTVRYGRLQLTPYIYIYIYFLELF
jgi:hypothetical protein